MPMEFVRTYHAQAHEITDAITAVVINAQAGLQFQLPVWSLVQLAGQLVAHHRSEKSEYRGSPTSTLSHLSQFFRLANT